MDTLKMLLEYFKRDKKGIYGIIIILSIIMYGVLGSMLIMKLDFYDSIYYTIITIATVGFGDITPTTTIQKIFSATLALSGVGLLAYILTIIISSVTENLQDIRSGRHMEKRLAEMENHYVLCGFGRVGLSVFEELKKIGPIIWVPGNHEPKISFEENYEINSNSMNLHKKYKKLSKDLYLIGIGGSTPILNGNKYNPDMIPFKSLDFKNIKYEGYPYNVDNTSDNTYIVNYYTGEVYDKTNEKTSTGKILYIK